MDIDTKLFCPLAQGKCSKNESNFQDSLTYASNFHTYIQKTFQKSQYIVLYNSMSFCFVPKISLKKLPLSVKDGDFGSLNPELYPNCTIMHIL